MENRRKKKIITAFFVFLGLMWLCTVISKSIYSSRLPIVSTVSAEQKYIEHIVQTDGIVVAGDKKPVTTVSGLRVESLTVQAGDSVEEGDVVFTVDTEDLQDIIEERRTAIAKLQAQIGAAERNEELARQQKALDEQRAREDYDATARREDTLVGRAANEISKVEEQMEGDGDDGYSEEALSEALQQAAYAEADARWQRDEAMKEAERRVEDTTAPDAEDASLEVSRLELGALQEELDRFQAIADAGGQIYAQQGGLVTDIYVSIGGRTSDSAAMLLSDDSVPCRFKTVISQEQKKYIGLHDTVTLKLDGSREKEMTVDYLAESDSVPGSYDVYIDLPEGVGTPGISGELRCAKSGEKQPCCVPAEAVYTVNARSYVYVAQERDGILGKEYYASQINVKIIDQNDSWAAVESALDGDSLVIASSTKELENGAAVRPAEE